MQNINLKWSLFISSGGNYGLSIVCIITLSLVYSRSCFSLTCCLNMEAERFMLMNYKWIRIYVYSSVDNHFCLFCWIIELSPHLDNFIMNYMSHLQNSVILFSLKIWLFTKRKSVAYVKLKIILNQWQMTKFNNFKFNFNSMTKLSVFFFFES